MVHSQRSRIDKWDLYKAKDIVNRTNKQPTDWETIFTNSTSDTGLISKKYKELKKLMTKKPNPIKMGYRTNQRIHNIGIPNN